VYRPIHYPADNGRNVRPTDLPPIQTFDRINALLWRGETRRRKPRLPADRGAAPSLCEVLHAPPSARDDSIVSSGRNLFIEWRSAEGRAERLPDLATELVASNVDLIVSVNTQTTLATK
jgi:hypothetical protein